MWHELTQQARSDDKLVLLGVIQEQHPDRCRLFAQWKQFDWPILHDPINALKPRAVPIFVAIDEAGVVVDADLKTDEYEAFLNREPTGPSNPEKAKATEAAPSEPDAPATDVRSAGEWEAVADHHILWGGSEKLDAAIAGYQRAIELKPNSPAPHFSLGVAHRMRFESEYAEPSDFQAAIDAWGAALELDPNHYIYRRRIQQYGPRLIKPYPFYDWVKQARREIRLRGEVPVSLSVAPSGAEIAQPSRSFNIVDQQAVEPDPKGRITRDTKQLIDAAVVTVPAKIKPGEAARIHVQLKPNRAAHWNNEVEPLKLWIEIPSGWEIDRQLMEIPLPNQPESNEVRRLEFEIRCPDDFEQKDQKELTLPAYALFYICEEVNGQCLYLRKDLELPIRLDH